MSQSTVKKIPNNYFDGMPVTGFHKIVFFIIMMAYFCEQMDNWNFGFIAPALMHTWGLQMSDIGVVTLWYFIGMTAGGFFGGVISDFIGRRKTFLISIATFSFFSVLNGFTDNFHVFVIARSMTGFGVFCLMVCSQAYIAEMAPAESRGKWQNLVAAVGFSAVPVIGVMCRAIIPLAEEAWRYIFYFGGVGLIAFFVGLRYLKESPRWLVARGRLEEAEQVVFEITGKHVDLSEAAKNVQTKVPVMEVLTGMFRRQYIKRTLVLLAIVVFTNPATFTVTNWTATLLKAHGFSARRQPYGHDHHFHRRTRRAVLLVLRHRPWRAQDPDHVYAAHPRRTWPHLREYDRLLARRPHRRRPHRGRHGYGLHGLLVHRRILPHPYAQHRHRLPQFHRPPRRGRGPAAHPYAYAAYSFDGVFWIFSFLCFVPAVVIAIWGQRTGGKSLEEIA